jgi:hypothetical protein
MSWESNQNSERKARWAERLLFSILGGIFIPSFLLYLTFLVAGVEKQLLSPDSQVYLPFLWSIEWPEYLLSHFVNLTFDGALAALVLGNFIGYSLLTYLIFWLRDRRRIPKLP